jgi:hypothetical protein
MTDDEYQLTNRQKGQQTKLGWFWCGCDRQIVGLGRKCSVCGKRNIKNRRRLKNKS